MENKLLKPDMNSNPFDLKEIINIAIKKKILILVFFICSLLSVFFYILFSKRTYSSQIYINSHSAHASHIKYILTDLQTMIANQSNEKIHSQLKKYFKHPEQIQSFDVSFISDNDINSDQIVKIEIIGLSDSVIQFANAKIIDYLIENKFIKNLLDLSKSKLTNDYEIIKQNIKIIEHSIKEFDSLMIHFQCTKNTVLPGAKGEMVETLVKLTINENDLFRSINTFQPFVIVNEPVVICVSSGLSNVRLFLIWGFFGLAFGLFVAVFIEYSRK